LADSLREGEFADTLIDFRLLVVIAAAAISRVSGKTPIFLTIVVVGMK
jgi:hypothetical protein